jgi:hypothetical protein
MTTDQLDGVVAPVWTQRTADSNYTVVLDTGEGVTESGVIKKSVKPSFSSVMQADLNSITFFEFPVEGRLEDEPDAAGLETVTVFENYFPERIVYLQGSIAFGGGKN